MRGRCGLLHSLGSRAFGRDSVGDFAEQDTVIKRTRRATVSEPSACRMPEQDILGHHEAVHDHLAILIPMFTRAGSIENG